MKLAAWNVNSIKARLAHLVGWLGEAQPDVVCLQELKTEDAKFPLAEIEQAGYRVVYSGQKAYNGVAILSRHPIEAQVAGIPGFDDDHKRVIAASTAGLRVICVYCPNGQAPGTDKYAYKLRWFAALRNYLAAELNRHRALVVCGDFNVAPEDRDVHDPQAWEGQIHVSEPERAAWRALIDLGLKDAFRLFDQPEKMYSWWDYRMLGFRRNAGLRIDHLLLSDALVKRCTGSSIDKAPRKLEKPSDHAPVLVELAG